MRKKYQSTRSITESPCVFHATQLWQKHLNWLGQCNGPARRARINRVVGGEWKFIDNDGRSRLVNVAALSFTYITTWCIHPLTFVNSVSFHKVRTLWEKKSEKSEDSKFHPLTFVNVQKKRLSVWNCWSKTLESQLNFMVCHLWCFTKYKMKSLFLFETKHRRN